MESMRWRKTLPLKRALSVENCSELTCYLSTQLTFTVCSAETIARLTIAAN